MTRETKIGLLVGLAFIIVIGILLSDHFRSTMEPPQAALGGVAPNVRQAVNVAGVGSAPPQVVMPPAEVSPRVPVQTPRDIDPPAGPVVPLANYTPQCIPSGVPQNDGQPPSLAGTALAQTARQQGEEIVPVGPQPVQPAATNRAYKAGPGDTVSRMAAKFLGGNTRPNRDAIVRANPSLRNDPNKVIVGQTYVIPTAGGTAADLVRANPTTENRDGTQTVAGADGPGPGQEWVYTVKPGDNLWRIADSQLSSPDEIDAIKELNRDVLRGGSTVRPGMKLRLPAKPVASVN